MRIGALAGAFLVTAASSAPGAPPAPSVTSTADPSTCAREPFAESTPVPEASGAAWIDFGGKPALLVTSDSGDHGAYAIVDAGSGATLEEGNFPLGNTTDDLEGLSARDGKIYGVISPGWIYVWKRGAHGYDLVDGPYALGPVDLPPKKGGNHPPAGTGMVCDAGVTNCGRNYEGLCLRPGGGSDANGCTGYVAAKADGHLYCLTADAHGRLAVTRDHAIAIDRPAVLADCTYADDGSLWAADNMFGLADVFRVDVDRGSAAKFASLGVGFPEVLAVRGDVFYRMSDTGGAPSLMAKFRCPARSK